MWTAPKASSTHNFQSSQSNGVFLVSAASPYMYQTLYNIRNPWDNILPTYEPICHLVKAIMEVTTP
jgi:hypothetical protein